MLRTSSIAKASTNPARHRQNKFIYSFEEGDRNMRELLGGKGANLAEMTKIGVPVPPGFTISTEACELFLEGSHYPDGFADELQENLQKLEKRMERKFGGHELPLLVSVRSGAAVSMPGMMDTILNLGLNDETVEALAKETENPRFAYDSYRRFVQMFGNVVLGIDHELFEGILDDIKKEKGVDLDTEIGAESLRELVARYKKLILEKTGNDFPEKPLEQLKYAIEAVFNSWDNERAIAYRRIHGINGLKGTAVTVQSMVFGNMGEDSGTGVAFTRNPSTGEKEFYGEFLMNAQGEDVVAGIRTPLPISKLAELNSEVYGELVNVKDLLEKHYRDMQDIEFTIEKGKLFLLQTRNGKRTANAAITLAVEMVAEGLLTKEQALLKIDAKQLNQLLHPQIKQSAAKEVVAKGLPASPGAACGKVVFTAEAAISMVTEQNEKVVLVRKETSPEDIQGMHVAQGILTARGGMTSHAAVVCRGMGKCCVSGCTDIIVNSSAKKLIIGDLVINEGDIITLDGDTGEVILGEMEMQQPQMSGNFKTVMEWADSFRRLEVRTNADTPEDCRIAVQFGAEGIGLCRTEHMFFDEARIPYVRKMILARDEADRDKSLSILEKFQTEDFREILKVMDGRPVTIRLLDPPLHEFLPSDDGQIEQLAEDLGMNVEIVKESISKLHEVNPMLGHRGCRLGISYPDIYTMQVRSIAKAANEVKKAGQKVNVEIEIPLVGDVKELIYLREVVEKTLREVSGRASAGSTGGSYSGDTEGASGWNFKIGTMIEVPRACLTADEIAEYADFFSFGTNDLTQMTFGYSRDDVAKFLPIYLEKGILDSDPMAGIDEKGVGKLMIVCIELARKVKPHLEIGICGEQGGDPESVEFCHNIGLDYVSCSPYRVPIARLAAAQAVVKGA